MGMGMGMVRTDSGSIEENIQGLEQVIAKLRQIAGKGRRNEFLWRYGFNFAPTADYKLRNSRKPKEQEYRVINRLNRDGIAITSVNELGTLGHFEELAGCVDRLMGERHEELDRLKKQAGNSGPIGEKTFNVELLGSPLEFDPSCIYARFALQESILSIANAYFGMRAELRYYNVWNTFATSGEARESQLWHFDREDNYILKIFLYLDTVDDGAGPFTYAPGTHRKGPRWNQNPEYFLENNVRRSTDEQMSKVVPQSEWIRALGQKGTLVFADTRGFHKGGEARDKDRLMYTCMFTSPASQSKRLLTYSRSNSTK